MEFEYVKAIKADEIKENEGKMFRLANGTEVAFFLANGSFHAFDNKCPHMGMPLCEGIIIDKEVLMCRYHQWKFNLKTGVSTFAPNIYLKKFEMKIEDGFIFVKVPKY
ncbi:MAG TPA: Rieske (2Fe-2S) protein [Candidatus Wallbacteria bacterium]|nr:Rieske (2Fe-2S) protein [Candidatus Wallbacteria bacterium]